jgi:uncharacterized protein (DUF2141 family)
MKQIITLFLAFTSILLCSFTDSNKENYSLTVEVENLRNSKGIVQITLYNKDGSIPDEHYKNYFKMEKVNITNGKCLVLK